MVSHSGPWEERWEVHTSNIIFMDNMNMQVEFPCPCLVGGRGGGQVTAKWVRVGYINYVILYL